MNKEIRIWVVRAIILLLLAATGYKWGIPLYKQYLTPKKKNLNIPTAVAKSGEFKVSFHQNGTLDARDSVPVVSSIRGKLISIIEEGAIVKAGSKIAELDTSDVERDVRDKKLRYENTLADLKRKQMELDLLKEQNKTEIIRVQTELDFSKAELARVMKRRDTRVALANEKLIARSDVDQAESDVKSKELDVKTREMDLSLAMKEVESSESQKMADVRNKEFVSNMAKIELEDAERYMNKSIITAPAAGMVVLTKVRDDSGNGRRPIRAGDNVNPRRTLCQLPDLSSMLVTVQVGESSSPRISLGMPVLIKLEAVNGKLYHGTVKSIANLATEEDPRTGNSNSSGARTFTVTIDVKERDPKTLKPGMTADVEFLEKSVNNAVYVPYSAIYEKAGKVYAYIKRNGKFTKIQVSTGLYNNNLVCINKGIKKGDIVALRDPTDINEESMADTIGDKNP